jgi:hypothetical protein
VSHRFYTLLQSCLRCGPTQSQFAKRFFLIAVRELNVACFETGIYIKMKFGVDGQEVIQSVKERPIIQVFSSWERH